MQFKKIELEDKKIIERFFHNNDQLYGCECTFANMFMWGDEYGTQYATENDVLYVRNKYLENEFYFMPIALNKDLDIKAGIDRLLERKEKIVLNVICEEYKEKLFELYEGRITQTKREDYSDYIYNTSDLAQLAGKKYHSKRNHIKKFHSLYPGAVYEPITADNISEVIAFDEKWRKENDMLFNEDHRATRKALDNYEALELKGGLIRYNGEVIAYTFGSEMNNKVFDVHAEKADYNYQGSYTVINNEFAKTLLGKYQYINREEDLGIEGLRKAKRSYYPAVLLLKCFCIINR